MQSESEQQGQQRNPTHPLPRYSVRFETAAGEIQEAGVSTDLNAQIALAKRLHRRYGLKVWAFNTGTMRTVYRIERAGRWAKLDPETGCTRAEMRASKGGAR